jgi:hypothetical protein
MVMIHRKVWLRSAEPYSISLTLKTLQGMLNNELPMDRDCFNLVVRKNMFDDIQTVKKKERIDIKALSWHAILGIILLSLYFHVYIYTIYF